MTSHGSRMLAATQKERNQRAASFGSCKKSTDVTEQVPGLVTLTPAIAGIMGVTPWDELAEKHQHLDAKTLKTSKHCSVFALQHREGLNSPWKNVFAVRDGGQFVLYSVTGMVLDGSRASVAELLSKFTKEGFYFRPPRVRASPARNRVAQCRAQKEEAQPEASDAVKLLPIDDDAFEKGSMLSSSEDEVQPLASAASSIESDSDEVAPIEAPSEEVKPPSPVREKAATGESALACVCVEKGQCTAAAPAESSSAQQVSLPLTLVTGSRVCIRKAGADDVCGMVACKRYATIVVATDQGTWETIPLSEVGVHMFAENTQPPADIGVVGFAYDHTNKNVTGMLMGSANETALGGKMHAFCAHVARPLAEDAGLRETRKRDEELHRPISQSFHLGDIVKQVGDPSQTSPVFAAVVRVLYARRGQQQSRRMLILLELDSHKKLKFSSTTGSALFFPASWSNWGQLSPHTMMEVADIDLIDKVRSATTR